MCEEDSENKTRLTEMQVAFVEHYVTGLRAADAARLAGYNGKYVRQTAYETLKKPHVKEAIREAVEQAGITEPEYKAVGARLLLNAIPETLTAEEWLHLFTLIGKMLGLFTEQVKIDQSTTINAQELIGAIKEAKSKLREFEERSDVDPE